jgi:hypothetical protein
MPDQPKPTDPRELTDDELRRHWCAIEEHDNLAPFDQVVIDEMARRNLDF